MHELAVCQELIRTISGIAATRGGRAVSEVHVRIGPLSGVEAALLERAFPIAAAGTVASGARLCTHSQLVRVRCNECGAESAAKPNRLLCGPCGSWRTSVIAGDELLLERVFIDRETNVGCEHV